MVQGFIKIGAKLGPYWSVRTQPQTDTHKQTRTETEKTDLI